ncbi:MAG: hypothetical protein ABIC40_05995 [bacterium]
MKYRFIFLVSFLALIAVSCSNRGTGADLTSPAPLANEKISASSGGANHNLWGFYRVSIDPINMTADAVPLRCAEFTCNVTRFMQPPVSHFNMVSFSIQPGSIPSEGFFKVEVTLKHPFPGLPYYRGFDVRGIVISNGSLALNNDPSATYAGEDDTRLLNADGFTRWWNPTEFTSYGKLFGFTLGKLALPIYPTATLNAYKYFAEGLESDQAPWETITDYRGTFATSPGVYTRPYDIQFPMDGGKVDFAFNYAIDASWFPPDDAGAPDYDVEYYPLSANMAEAYAISVVDNGSTAWYVDDTDKGGEINLAIRVYDWQSVENPDGTPGELAAIWLESPVLDVPIDVLPSATILPDGPTSSVFEVNLGALNLTESGDEPLVIFAESADTFGYEPQVPGGNAFDFPDAPLGSYLMTTVNIKSQGIGDFFVTAIDPDQAQSDDVLIGVEVTGSGFMGSAQVELRMDGQNSIAATNEVVTGGGTIITCDLDLDIAAAGYWDVVVINPGPVEAMLEDGFLIDCASEVHTYEGKHYINGISNWNYCQRGDLCILETGTYAGQCVVKSYYTTATGAPGDYIRFDPDNPSDVTGTYFFTIPGRIDSVNTYITMTAQIDQNPVNGHIGVVNGRMFDTVQIVDQNGTPIEDVIVTDPQTPSGYIPTIPGLDFDVDGDMWFVVNVKGIPDETGDPIWQLRHYELQSSSPYYVENLGDRLDISEDLYDPTAEPYGHMWYVADIAISYTEDSLFVFSAAISGTRQSLFTKYDLSTSPPTFVMNKDLVDITQCTNPFSGISRADIDFDHSDLSVENCRLLVMYQDYDTNINGHLMRLDTDLNILNDYMFMDGWDPWDNPHAFAINTDPDNRNLIMIDMHYSAPFNDFFYFPMPTEGW